MHKRACFAKDCCMVTATKELTISPECLGFPATNVTDAISPFRKNKSCQFIKASLKG